MRLASTPTRFDRYADFTFDDPARDFASEPQDLFEGELDRRAASLRKDARGGRRRARHADRALTSRVFERGGAFSINRAAYVFALPALRRREAAEGRRRARHVAHRRASYRGASESVRRGRADRHAHIEVTLYKVDWKWWWDKSGDSLAQYAERSHTSVVQQSVVSSTERQGRLAVRNQVSGVGSISGAGLRLDGGHCAGQTFYIDWPMWAGRAQDQSGPAASVLVFTADKEKYEVGDTATIQLPETKDGRALFTVESGTSILEARWIDFARDSNRVAMPVTQAMAPNVYASVTLVQPHGKANDRPIRLYGVIPIHVTDRGPA